MREMTQPHTPSLASDDTTNTSGRRVKQPMYRAPKSDRWEVKSWDWVIDKIARKIKRNNIFFDGYWKNGRATDAKFRDGYFRSGDLGHIRVLDGRRYLHFDGRTDDRIRKEAYDFSAENGDASALYLPDRALALAPTPTRYSE